MEGFLAVAVKQDRLIAKGNYIQHIIYHKNDLIIILV
jgi:hypothetical protein